MKPIFVFAYVSELVDNYAKNGTTFKNRTFTPSGWFLDFHDCVHSIEKNLFLIKGEGHEYVVIEQKEEGINTKVKSSFWFEIDYKNKKLVSIEKPKDINNLYGFTI